MCNTWGKSLSWFSSIKYLPRLAVMSKPQPNLESLHTLATLQAANVVDAHIPALEGSHRLIEFISPLHGEQPSNVCNGKINTMFRRVLEHNMNSMIQVLSGKHKTVTLHGMRVHKDGRISIQARWIRVDAAGEGDKIIYQKMQRGKGGVELGYAGWAVKGSARVTKEQLIPDPNAGIGAYLKTSNIYVEACGTDSATDPEWFKQMYKDISKFSGYVGNVRKSQSTRTQPETKTMNANGTNQTTSLGSMKKDDLKKECEARELVVKSNDTRATLIARINRFEERIGNKTTAAAPVVVDPRVAEIAALQAQIDALMGTPVAGAPVAAAPVAAAPAEKPMLMKEQREIFKQMKHRNDGPLPKTCEGMSLKDALAQGLVTVEAIIAFKAKSAN